MEFQKLYQFLDTQITTLHGKTWKRYPGDLRLSRLFKSEIEEIESLTNQYQFKGVCLKDKISLVRAGLPKNPTCKFEGCNKLARWDSETSSWRQSCSGLCDKKINCLKNWGVDNVSKSPIDLPERSTC